MTTPSLPDPSARLNLFQLMTGHYISHAIYTAAKLSLADHLASGPLSAEKLARASGAHAGSLRRLMRLLISVGVFAETEEGSFALNEMAGLLRSGVAGSSRAAALLFAGPTMGAWAELLHAVRTGEPTFERVYGMDAFKYMTEHPENAAIFNEAMTAVSTQVALAVPAAYDFSRFRTIVDVGGGHGVLLISILKANPGLRGILFELPHAIEGAKKRIEAAGMADRCETAAGDFFEGVPAGADVYISKSVIHDWDDARSTAILKNCCRAMAREGKMLLVEAVVPQRTDQSLRSQIIAGSDINMLVNVGGRERTDAEFRALYEAAGLRLTRISPLEGSLSSVLEGECA